MQLNFGVGISRGYGRSANGRNDSLCDKQLPFRTPQLTINYMTKRSRYATRSGLFLITGYLVFGFMLRAAPRAEFSETNLPPYSTSLPLHLHSKVDRASFNLRRPGWRALYTAIAGAYGIQLLYDVDLGEPQLTSDFRLENVTLEQALEAAGNISKTFVAPVDEHTGIVSADAPQKRAEHERQVLGNFLMDDQTTAQELTEIGSALRTIIDLRRVVQDTRSGWISVVGRTRQVEIAKQFVRGLQKGRGEVMLDVDIIEVDSQRARELGILPPQPFQLLYFGLSGPTAGVSALTFGAGRTLYGLSLPGAAAPLTFSSSAVRFKQALQMRASNGQEASLLFGERYPVLNGIVSSSFFVDGSQNAATAIPGSYPSVQYEDLGIKFKATPYLHSGGELTLKFDMSLRSLGSQSLNGAPVISNRQVTEQVRLRDGENYLIAGILGQQQDNSVSGYPLLSRLPVVGALFSTRKTRQFQTEYLMVIRAHVLREPAAEDHSFGPIYFGKELQGLPAAPAPPPPTPQTPAPPPTPGGPFPPGFVPQIPGAPLQPGAQPQPGTQPQPAVPGVPVPGNLAPGFAQPPAATGVQTPDGQTQIPPLPGTFQPGTFQPGTVPGGQVEPVQPQPQQ